MFKLPDFLEDDDEDDYEPPVKRRKRKKVVPLHVVDDEDGEDEDNGDNDNKEEDKDYEVDNKEGDDDDEQDDDEENDDEEDDEEIMLQAGKAEQRKRKRLTAVVKSKDTEVVEERRTVGQHCANVDQATEFRKYIHDVMKTFEGHIRKGKQVKKYLLEMIQDVREACMNM